MVASDMTRSLRALTAARCPRVCRERQTAASRRVRNAAMGQRQCASCSSPPTGSATPCCPPDCWTTCCARTPEARFTVACGPVAEGVFARMPRRDAHHRAAKTALWPALAAAMGRDGGTRWDLVVDIRGSALAWMLPARRRAVMRRAAGHKTAQLAAMLGLDPPPLPVVWTAPAGRGTRRLPCCRRTGRVVALAPTANWAPKVWPPQRFAELFTALRECARMTPSRWCSPARERRSGAWPRRSWPRCRMPST